MSGPLRDRIDLAVDVPALPPDLLGSSATGESSATVRARVVAARERQRLRCGDDTVRTNAELTPAMLLRHCVIDRAGARLLDTAIRRMAFSARGYDRLRRVARTITDLAGADVIGADQLAEALQFRMVEGG